MPAKSRSPAESGKITLEGTVDSRHTKNAIEDIAEHLGIEDVQNNLRVQRGLLSSLFGSSEQGASGSETSGTESTTGGAPKDKGDPTRQRH